MKFYDSREKTAKKRSKAEKNSKRTETKQVYVNDDYVEYEFDDETENELRRYSEAREERKLRKKRRKRRLVSIVVLIFVALFFYVNWDVLSPTALADTLQNFFGSFGKSKYPVSFDEGSTKSAVSLGSNVGVLTDTSFIIYSKKGDRLDVRPHGINNPSAVSSGTKALIYDRGGKQFKVETRFGELFSSTASYNITTAAIGKKGNFAVVTQADNYLSELTVYNTSYKSVFKWDATQGRILSAALSPDGKKLAAILIGVRNGSMFSDIYIFNLSSKTPVAVKKYDGQLLYSIAFKDNKRIAAVGDEETVFLTASGEEKSIYNYKDKVLLCSSNGEGPVVLVFGKNASQSMVVSLGNEGKLLGSADIPMSNVTIVSNSGGKTIAVADGKIWHASDNCDNAKVISVSEDVEYAFSSNGYAYVFGSQSIGRYKLN